MMTLILSTLLLPLSMLVAIYLILLACASWRHRPNTQQADPQQWGVLIPAHDEQEVIARTVRQIHQSHYPRQNIKVMVIADNCSDRTATKARKAGAEVFVRNHETERGKGYALDWFLKKHKDAYTTLDAICIMDADSTMDSNFLSEMDRSLASPQTQVVQGSNRVSNLLENWRTALVHAAFSVFNHLRMAGSQKVFRTSTLKGNGMAFRPHVLAELSWPAYSCIEDLEYTMVLADHGIRVSYQPSAVISSAMIAGRKQATIQRRRWEAGRLIFSYRNLWRVIKRGHWALFFDLITPPLSLYALVLTLGTLVALPHPFLLVLYLAIWVGLGFVVISAQIQCQSPLKVWIYLCLSPLFVMWKAMMYAKWLLFGCSQAWTKSIRQSES